MFSPGGGYLSVLTTLQNTDCVLGEIIAAVLNAPGSWHDANVCRPIFEKIRQHVPDGYYAITDTAFPRGSALIAGKIKAPLKGGQRITADPVEQAKILQLNRQLLSYRQTAEWGMRGMQGSFGRLRVCQQHTR